MHLLQEEYENLWQHSLTAFKKYQFEADPLIDNPDDDRYGLTLRIRPSRQIRKAIVQLLEEHIKPVAPNQYFYPASDLHVTVLSIISCYSGFRLEEIDVEDYRRRIRSALSSTGPFDLRFQGLTASPSCIMICGYPSDNQLHKLRDNLRETFRQSPLEHSIDKRYRLQTAHCTAIRFCKPLHNPDTFIAKIQEFKQQRLGICTVRAIELVANDWYQQKNKVKVLETFDLNQKGT